MAKPRRRGHKSGRKTAGAKPAAVAAAPRMATEATPPPEGVQQRTRRARVRRQRMRLLKFAGAAVVLMGVAIVLLLSRGPQPGESIPALAGIHGGNFRYNSRPPTSGNHTAGSLRPGFTDVPLAAEAALHNMEHGAVVLWFQPGDADLAFEINQLVRALGNSCLLAGPYSNMDTAVAATAWGRLLTLDEFDSQQLREFVDAYRGKTGPEGGVCRTQA